MALLEQGQLYQTPEGSVILPEGNTLSSEQERWQYRGYIYNMTGKLWDVRTDEKGNILGQGLTPEYQNAFYEGMDLWNRENMGKTQEAIDRMNEQMFEEQRKIELDFARQQQEELKKRWQSGDITAGEAMQRFGEIKAGQAYVYDPEKQKWSVKHIHDLTGNEKAYTYTGADYQEGLEYVKEVYSQYQQMQTDISDLINNQVAQERADYELRGVEYNISDEEIQRRKEEKLNEMVSEDERNRMDELLLEFGTPLIEPTQPSDQFESYRQTFMQPQAQTSQGTTAPPGPQVGESLLAEQ
jgi:hypothetical protein